MSMIANGRKANILDVCAAKTQRPICPNDSPLIQSPITPLKTPPAFHDSSLY